MKTPPTHDHHPATPGEVGPLGPDPMGPGELALPVDPGGPPSPARPTDPDGDLDTPAQPPAPRQHAGS